MIFIYESQQIIPGECSKDYQVCYPLKESLNQYKFLYQLNIETLKEIDNIYFLCTNELDLKLYKYSFSSYSPDLENYKDSIVRSRIFELTLLPTSSEISDKAKINIIVRLIQNQKFIRESAVASTLVTDFKDDEIIIHLPLSGKIINNILQQTSLNKMKLRLFTTYEEMRVRSNSGVIEVNPELYLEIDNKLKNVINNLKGDFSADRYYYMPKPLLDIFESDFLGSMSLVKNGTERKVQIYGEDEYLADRAITHMLSSNTPIYYNLLFGIPQITNYSMPSVFSHFESVKDADDFRKLFEKTENLLKYIILKSLYKVISPYFNDYHAIELPKREIIEQVISSILIAFLTEKEMITSEFYKLYPMIISNSFFPLLKDFRSLETLYTVLGRIKNISAMELLSKTDIWYFLITEMKRIDKGNISHKQIKQHRKIEFDYSDIYWEITGIGKRLIFEYSKNIGIKYLAIIIYHQKIFQKPIDAKTLRKIANNLGDKPLREFKNGRDIFTDDKAIGAGLKILKSIPAMQEFCDKYICHSKCEYWFDSKNEIECEIRHPKITPDFLESYCTKSFSRLTQTET